MTYQKSKCFASNTVFAMALLFTLYKSVSAQIPVEEHQRSDDETKIAMGRARVIVFMKQKPIAGVIISVGDVSAVTNSDGTARLLLTEGRYEFTLTVSGEILSNILKKESKIVSIESVDVVADETVEVIATLSPAGELISAQIESVVDPVQTPEERVQREIDDVTPMGRIVGTVISVEKLEPVRFAKVVVRGQKEEVETDIQGKFLLKLPVGTYDLSIIHSDFTTQRVQRTTVKADEATEITVELTPASLELQQFVVTAPHIEGGIASLVAERRESTNVTDVIGAEEMSRTGDSDAAGALRRVTGITIVGGKFVYVRGMGERYSSTLLNGQSIPSPEPERRVIPLDLFPTDVLEGVVIQKSYSPDMPGEFGGGVVQLRTKSYPDEFVLDILGSLGGNTVTTFRKLPTYEGGSLDWLGTDDGSRDLPQEVRAASPILERDREHTDRATDQERAEFARMFVNRWNVYNAVIPADRGLSLSLGNQFVLDSVPLGFVLTGIYDDNYTYEQEEQNWYSYSEAAKGGLQPTSSYTIKGLNRTVSSGAFLNLGCEYLPGQTIKASSLLLRISKISTQIRQGLSDDLGDNTWMPRLEFVEQQLFAQQIMGEQKIDPLNSAQIDWRYGYSTAFRDEPFRREYFFGDDLNSEEVDYRLSSRGGGVASRWAEMDDNMHNIGLDYTQPISLWDELEGKAKAGAMFTMRDRDYQALRFNYNAPTGSKDRGISNAELRTDPDTIFQPENFDGERGWTLSDNTQASDEFSAEHDIEAGYGMLTLPIFKPLELSFGARIEHSLQSVRSFHPFNPDDEYVAELDNTDVLPVSTISWRIIDEMILRFGYGRTVSRPDLRELSPARYRDLKKNMIYLGNTELKRATIENFDTRWEFYFSTDEFISVGGFYKVFTDPIELVMMSGQELAATWNNAEGAINIGVEFEARRRLDFIDKNLELFYLTLNFSWIESKVDLGNQALASTSVKRSLQGQSPFVFNTQFGYDDSADGGSGISAAILYNVFGRRIDEVGRDEKPDIYEEPFHQLDFIYALRLGYGFHLKCKAKNILNLEQQFKQGNRIHRRYYRGRSFSLGLSWRY